MTRVELEDNMERASRGLTLILVVLCVGFMVAAGWYVQTRPQTIPPPAWYWPRVHQIERHEAQAARATRRYERHITERVVRVIDRYLPPSRGG